jgi:hypothetical protein
MGFIKTLVGLILVLAIAISGYWLYASYVSAPNAPYWAQLNSVLPDPIRKFSCDQTRKRIGADTPVPSCEGI